MSRLAAAVRGGLGALALVAGLYAVVVRPRLLRWGASADEVTEP
jgi:hypothetical protein